MSGLEFLSPRAQEALTALVDERIADALRQHREAKRWLSVRECAEYLGTTETAVRRRISRGRIPARHQGRAVLIDRHALDREIEAS